MIESPISDLKLEALGVSREKMLERIAAAVSFAVENGITVAFFGVDSTRADLDFYRRAYETAVEAGASEVVAVDTIGVATPEAAAYLVGRTADWLDVPVHWHGHNDFGLATAAAAAAVQAGRPGSTAPSTAWASGRATRTCSRSRSRSRPSTGSRRGST